MNTVCFVVYRSASEEKYREIQSGKMITKMKMKKRKNGNLNIGTQRRWKNIERQKYIENNRYIIKQLEKTEKIKEER